jgi:hypothetical protein
MRQRLRPIRERTMARRTGEEGRFTLSPRVRLMVGWVVAVAIIGVVAFVVGTIGGNADGQPVVPTATPSASAGGAAPIAFGTALDPETAQVPDEARTDRFAPGDTFAYAVAPSGSTPPSVYVEVERTAGGPVGVVQPPEGEQPIPQGRPAIAFTVAADLLFEDFGPGTYVMRIFEDPTGEAVAEGTFTLVGPPAASEAAPSASP